MAVDDKNFDSANVSVDFNQIIGTIKPMNAVNNGPVRPENDQTRGNFNDYKALNIPYARLHDAGLCYSYGAPHTVDVNQIFTDPDADENDPASYDFVLTDEYLSNIIAAGTQVFYRLGASIEHWSKKYNIIPPKDFAKWARICEHIIRHYNEGWADGFHWNIIYWEIWNEPDTWSGGPCWSGTKEQFFDLFSIASCHLKKCFPNIKIGGPAHAGNMKWLEDFFKYMHENNVPMDFFSWHIYAVEPAKIIERSLYMRDLLDKHGYNMTENILNEYNYVRGWSNEWIYSLEQMTGIKGAAFTGACFCACQNSSVDMLMYYDARVSCSMNCIFSTVTLKRRKGYYAFLGFAKLAELKNQVKCDCDDPMIYAIAAKSENGEMAIFLCYYSEDDNIMPKNVTINTGLQNAQLQCNLTDPDMTFEPVWPINQNGGTFELRLQKNSVLLISLK